MTRTKLVPALVFLLGVLAIAAIVGLQQRAAAGRDAQLQLSTLRAELSQLQGAPLKGSAETGGSPEIAYGLMTTGKRRVAASLAELDRRSPVAALDEVARPLAANYAALDSIFALGAAGLTASEAAQKAAPLLGAAAKQMALVDAALVVASRQYDRRASAADNRATAGSAGAILLLLLAFALLYRRSVAARAIAERLSQENARLANFSREEARTDALTGLRNRRALIDDLETEANRPGGERDLVLGLFDLDGFKQYNDTFGHPAGDALLTRLGEQLRLAVSEVGTAYRVGGDEFCILAPSGSDDAALVRRAAAALTGVGDAFNIACSYGMAALPTEASTGAEALQLADRRMYEHKAAGRSSASRQSSDVLLKVLSERNADLREHLHGVARNAALVAERLGVGDAETKRIGLAAELHDVGKTAVPDAILNKPGPLDANEWEFMRRHTVIGERILLAAPSLSPTADLVRSSHERFDGGGYPDGLAGDAIPLGASIIAVCDAFDAMVAERPYSAAMAPAEALAELRRCAGRQFHPEVVEAFCALVTEMPRVPQTV